MALFFVSLAACSDARNAITIDKPLQGDAGLRDGGDPANRGADAGGGEQGIADASDASQTSPLAPLTEAERNLCARLCASDDVLFPGALCEDLAARKDDAYFCTPQSTALDCRSHCERSLTNAPSETCRARWNDVFTCVDAQGGYQQLASSPGYPGVCAGSFAGAHGPCWGEQARIRNQDLWLRQRPEDYAYEIASPGQSPRIIAIRKPTFDVGMAELFDRIAAGFDDGAFVKVEYDETFGYPRRLTVSQIDEQGRAKQMSERSVVDGFGGNQILFRCEQKGLMSLSNQCFVTATWEILCGGKETGTLLLMPFAGLGLDPPVAAPLQIKHHTMGNVAGDPRVVLVKLQPSQGQDSTAAEGKGEFLYWNASSTFDMRLADVVFTVSGPTDTCRTDQAWLKDKP